MGTLGAVISVGEPFPSRKALFDIAIAGPWAGLLAAVGLLLWMDTVSSSLYFFAAEISILITFLNLFPFGPLDGGHVFYSVVAKKSAGLKKTVLALFALYGVFIQTVVSPLMLLLMVLLFGIGHPPTKDDETPLGRPRGFIAWLTFIMFLALGTFGKQFLQWQK